ncbi:MAG: L-lactate permease [Leptotrichiaceae bacterium]|nr:L-lactate permease [Leptotrichiaceae bacterium]
MSLFFMGLVPIILFLFMLALLKCSPMLSAYTSLGAAILLNFIVKEWRMPVTGVIGSIMEGFAVAWMPIGLVVIAAIFAYELSVKTGEINVIKKMLGNITTDKRAQALILAWGFGGFIEGVAGYGTAVAIPAAIMVSLGFNPLNAAIMCLIANTTPTAFGTVGLPVTTMSSLLNLSPNEISFYISLLLWPIMFIIPFILVKMADNERKEGSGAFGDGIIPVIGASIIGYSVQPVIAKTTGAELPTILSSLLAMVLMIGAVKIFIKEKESTEKQLVTLKEGILAWLPYILMVVLIVGTSPVVHAVHELLEHTNSVFNFTLGNPEVFRDINGEVSKANVTFKWLLAPGVPIITATVIAGFFQKAKVKDMISVFTDTVKHKLPSISVIMGIVALSAVMKHSGMINSIADGFVQIMGKNFPLISPFLGTIGTFVTGSDLSSNLLFGNLQFNVAEGLKAGHQPLKELLIASNTAGATGGKMISPQNIAIAASTVGLMGKEGDMLRTTLKYSLVYAIVLGILVFAGSIIV